jgi:hypothetical protein
MAIEEPVDYIGFYVLPRDNVFRHETSAGRGTRQKPGVSTIHLEEFQFLFNYSIPKFMRNEVLVSPSSLRCRVCGCTNPNRSGDY